MVTDLDNYSRLQYSLLVWLVCVPPLLLTVIRIVLRYWQFRTLYADDLFATAGAVCLIVMAAIGQAQRDGLYLLIDVYNQKSVEGLSLQAIEATIASGLKLQFAIITFYWTCLWCMKASMMMFYRRLLNRLEGQMKWWWGVAAVLFVAYVGSLLTNFLACLPLSHRFSIKALECSLTVTTAVIRVATATDVVTDILVMILPIRLLYGLQISFKQKIGLALMFSLGVIVILFSVLRMVKVVPLIAESNPSAQITLAGWTMLESAIAVFTANLPPLKPLIAAIRKVSASRSSTRHTYGRKTISQTGKFRKTTSDSTSESPIRLQIMPTTVKSTIQGGRDSEEELNTNRDTKEGISMTRDVAVTFESRTPYDDRSERSSLG